MCYYRCMYSTVLYSTVLHSCFLSRVPAPFEGFVDPETMSVCNMAAVPAISDMGGARVNIHQINLGTLDSVTSNALAIRVRVPTKHIAANSKPMVLSLL